MDLYFGSRITALAVACLLAPAALAQNVTGTIVGTVHDSSGAVVSGARVTVVHQERNTRFATTTSNDGHYVAPQLFPGTYTVRAEAPGFQEIVKRGVRLF